MKFTIYGFSQQRALEFKKTIKKNGKETIIKLDCTDLLLLRWFVDYYPAMSKLTIDGKEYAWVNYSTPVKKDLPLLGVTKQSVYLRFSKMVEFGILDHKHVKDGGSYSYYRFGANYRLLIDTQEKTKNTAPQNLVHGENGQKNTASGEAKHGKPEKIIKPKEDCNTTKSVSQADFEREFEQLWKIYPNKKGKNNALKAYIKARKKDTTFEQVETGIKNYLKEIEAKGTQKSYIKHGSTWFNNSCWDDDYDLTPDNRQPSYNIDDYVRTSRDYILRQPSTNVFDELLKESKQPKRTIIDVGVD